MDLIDLTILETCNDHEQASRCVRVGLLCTQANSSLRPSMSTVNLMLSTKFMLLPDPTKPGFVSSVPTHGTSNPGSSRTPATTSSAASRHGLSSTSATTSSAASSHTRLALPSNANASITELEPR